MKRRLRNVTDNIEGEGLLNALIQINNDRALHYRLALNELRNQDDSLKIFFAVLIAGCQRHLYELETEIKFYNGRVEEGFRDNGCIYKIWSNIKSNFTVLNCRTIIYCCKRAEKTALNAYRALADHARSNGYGALIASQMRNIEDAYRNLSELNAGTRDAEVRNHPDTLSLRMPAF